MSTNGACHLFHCSEITNGAVTIEMDCFLDGLAGDGWASLQVCDGAGDAKDFDMGTVAPITIPLNG
ncbi:hypothetical protein M3226_16495 [Neobacillus cucumis]|nr:hypothetical protein [Neobacillus cucumis]MCM3727279.1 hypothetical protein [Neobacillus cucumis]